MNYYEINKETIALIPLDNNRTKIIEFDRTIIINKNSLQIIKDSCVCFGSSYEGRHEGTKKLIGISHKSPIIVEESHEIIFFPLSSPRLKECTWLSLKNIKSYSKSNKETLVKFDNNLSIKLNISCASFDNQYLHGMMLSMALKKQKEKIK